MHTMSSYTLMWSWLSTLLWPKVIYENLKILIQIKNSNINALPTTKTHFSIKTIQSLWVSCITLSIKCWITLSIIQNSYQQHLLNNLMVTSATVREQLYSFGLVSLSVVFNFDSCPIFCFSPKDTKLSSMVLGKAKAEMKLDGIPYYGPIPCVNFKSLKLFDHLSICKRRNRQIITHKIPVTWLQ